MILKFQGQSRGSADISEGTNEPRPGRLGAQHSRIEDREDPRRDGRGEVVFEGPDGLGRRDALDQGDRLDLWDKPGVW